MYDTTVVTCPAGTYNGNDNPTSAAQCTTCWEGHYCLGGLANDHLFPTPCPKGTYNPNTGGTSLADCLDCSAGVVCPYFGNREGATGLVCQGGFECLAATQSFRPSGSACPEGTYDDSTPYLDAVANC
jgi:ferredoxin-like protein FixX